MWHFTFVTLMTIDNRLVLIFVGGILCLVFARDALCSPFQELSRSNLEFNKRIYTRIMRLLVFTRLPYHSVIFGVIFCALRK